MTSAALGAFVVVRATERDAPESFHETETRNGELRQRILSELERAGLLDQAHFREDLGVAPVLAVECTPRAADLIRRVPGVAEVDEDVSVPPWP